MLGLFWKYSQQEVINAKQQRTASYAHPRPVLYRFCDMIGRDEIAISEVGNGTCQLEDAMISTCRQVQLLHGGFHQFFGVAGNFRAAESLQLA